MLLLICGCVGGATKREVLYLCKQKSAHWVCPRYSASDGSFTFAGKFMGYFKLEIVWETSFMFLDYTFLYYATRANHDSDTPFLISPTISPSPAALPMATITKSALIKTEVKNDAVT